jgi:hypothetical protein
VVEALQALRGVAKLTAITIVTEVGTFQRFNKPTDLMAYRARSFGMFERWQRIQGPHHAHRQRSLAPHSRRSRLARAAPTVDQRAPEEGAPHATNRGLRDRLEGAGAATSKVHEAHLSPKACQARTSPACSHR